ncbi:dipeptidyl aminopeptidase 2, putative [Plasmodium gallinaceum]|uniref:Dipeptidyl peptidase 1 n=1 Tax=Plasmodium gallinaceum TaxID=5849 RepID=A0A1J1GXW4_PLAGA|nr:dipeptidyl aminopeptidase 2, putative [Plasmodium gallinaceum]CRG97104.1 dipeptidyl aminopeptidase 2, putative [Plasmodium gallinaceum]
MKNIIFFFLFTLFDCLVKSDLPIHALMGDIHGVWKIRQTKKFSEKPEHCGGGTPNRNSENLSSTVKYYERFLENKYGSLEEIKIRLTLEKIKIINEIKPRDQWTYLAVKSYDDDEIIGYWTMVYDEGFEIRLKGRRYFGFFKYEKNSNINCPKSIEDKNSDENECYKTDPTETRIGWILDEKIKRNSRQKIFHWGCFYSEKEQDGNVSSFVIHNIQQKETVIDNNEKNEVYKKNKLNFSMLGKRSKYKKVRLSSLPKIYASTRTNLMNIYEKKSHQIYGCKKDNFIDLKIRLTLPKEFSWGDPFSDENFDEEVEDQKDCGSCYSISSIYCLKKRFEILFWKKYKKKIKIPKLSYQSILSCSPFNQGCDGGYPFLVGRQMYEYGVSSEKYMKCENNDMIPCKINMGDFNKSNNNDNNMDEIYYASDYYYINGCYECADEYDMMNEILLNGPIIAAINATPELLNLYNINKNKIYNVTSNENKICDVLNEGFNGWQQTNHAINIVGWGEQINENNKLVKYWIIRNTWGKKWGYKGYLKFQRGINLAGIESQAVFIDPDFSRGKAKILLD